MILGLRRLPLLYPSPLNPLRDCHEKHNSNDQQGNWNDGTHGVSRPYRGLLLPSEAMLLHSVVALPGVLYQHVVWRPTSVEGEHMT